MKFSSLIFLVFLGGYALKSQNLIKNPSFEDYSQCPDATEQFVDYVDDWYSFFATPDYNNLCGYAPETVQNDIFPRTGQGYAGILLYNFDGPNSPREYIQGEITTPLTANQSYYFEFYVHPTFPAIATNRQGVHFSENFLTTTPDPDSPDLREFYLDVEPHIENTEDILTEFEWTKVSGCYLASGGEKYITIGNFVSNQETDTTFLISWAQANQNFIDDVSLYALSSLVPNDTSFLLSNSLQLPDLVGQSYYYQGEEINSIHFIPSETGVHELEFFLEDCGFIGSFFVEVYDCEDLAEQYIPFLEDTTVCVEEALEFSLESNQDLTFYFEQSIYFGDSFTVPDSGDYLLGVYEVFISEIAPRYARRKSGV